MPYPSDHFHEIADDVLDEKSLRELWTVCKNVVGKSSNRWSQIGPKGDLEIELFNRFWEERNELMAKFDPDRTTFRSYARVKIRSWALDLQKGLDPMEKYEVEVRNRQMVRAPDGIEVPRQDRVPVTRVAEGNKARSQNPIEELAFEILRMDDNGIIGAMVVMLDELVSAGDWIYSSVLLVDIRVKHFGMSDKKTCNIMPLGAPDRFRGQLEEMFPWPDEVNFHRLHVDLRPKLDRIWREFFSHARSEVISRGRIANAVEVLVAAIKSLQADFKLTRGVWDAKLSLARKKLHSTEKASGMPFWTGYLELVSRGGRP